MIMLSMRLAAVRPQVVVYLAALAGAVASCGPPQVEWTQQAAVADGCSRTDRSGLSDVAAAVLSQIEGNRVVQSQSPVGLGKILSTCNRFASVQIDGPNIFAGARDIIAQAEHEVDIAFYKWDPDSNATLLIGDGLIAAQARRTSSDPLLVRIVLDDVELDFARTINHLWDSQKLWMSRGLDVTRVWLQLGTSPRSFTPFCPLAPGPSGLTATPPGPIRCPGARSRPLSGPLASAF